MGPPGRAAPSRGRTTRRRGRTRSGPAGWPPLLERCLPRADRSNRASPRNSRRRWRHPRALAHLPPARAHPCRPVPRQRVLPRGRISGLIDFYFAASDLLAYDVAVCLNAWCFEPDYPFNVTKARAMLRAYRDAAALGRRSGRPAGPVPRRGDPFPADPAVRLGEHPPKARWSRARTRWNISAGFASTAAADEHAYGL